MTHSLILAVPVAACATCFLLILALRPLLQRYALARPNARSSHEIPTPQGGGIAVVVAMVLAAGFAAPALGIALNTGLLVVFAAAIFMTCVGALDDLYSIGVAPRLLLQAIAVGAVLASLPADFHFVSALPLWVERALLLVAGLWFVNLVNFMDGIDWITVAEIVPVTAALGLLGMCGHVPMEATIVSIALAGAMIGFAPFNRPIAKLFLGDAGSLPIGLVTGWCLLQFAYSASLAAALLLPLYYICDATLTLARRLKNREIIWTAHRSHFYQRAITNRFTVMQVVGHIFLLNLVLAALAAASVFMKSLYVDAVALTVGMIAVAIVLARFSRPRNFAR